MGTRITRVLADDHAVLEWIARRAERAEDPTERDFLWREFVQMAGSHLLAIEKLILPALESFGANAKVPDLRAGVEDAQAALADTLTINLNDPGAIDSLSLLDSRLRHLREREGGRLAETLTACFDDGELTMLGAECQHFLSRRRLQIPMQGSETET